MAEGQPTIKLKRQKDIYNFLRPSSYGYENQTADQHAAFIGAESIGKHFGQHIRKLPLTKEEVPNDNQ